MRLILFNRLALLASWIPAMCICIVTPVWSQSACSVNRRSWHGLGHSWLLGWRRWWKAMAGSSIY